MTGFLQLTQKAFFFYYYYFFYFNTTKTYLHTYIADDTYNTCMLLFDSECTR